MAKWRRWIAPAIALAVIIAGVVIAFRIRGSGFDWERFWATCLQLHGGWFAASILLALATYFGRAIRWQVMMAAVKPGAGLWNLFSATAIGFTAVVLFGRPGELVRPYLISVKEQVTLTSQLAAWFLERIYDLLIVLLLFGYALTRMHRSATEVGPNIQWVLSVGGYFVAVVGTICMAVLILFRYFSEAMTRRLTEALRFLPEGLHTRAERLVSAFVSGMASTRSTSALGLVLLYTFLEWLIIVGCFYCLFQSFPQTARLGVMDVFIFVGFVAFGSVIQIPGIGGGMQVAGALVLTELYGLPLETATAVAILIWLITFVVIVPVGLLLAFHEGLEWGKLKHIGKDAWT